MDRRTREGYKLRIYIDAIKEVESMSDAEWVVSQTSIQSEGHYMTRMMWLDYLKTCALKEASKMVKREAA